MPDSDLSKIRASMGFIGCFVLGYARVVVNVKERAANKPSLGREMLADFSKWGEISRRSAALGRAIRLRSVACGT